MMQVELYFVFVDGLGAWHESGNYGDFSKARSFVNKEEALTIIQEVAFNLKNLEKVHLVTFQVTVTNTFYTPMYQSTPKGAIRLQEENASA